MALRSILNRIAFVLIASLAGAAISYAASIKADWKSGDSLTAEDLNNIGKAVLDLQAQVGELKSGSSPGAARVWVNYQPGKEAYGYNYQILKSLGQGCYSLVFKQAMPDNAYATVATAGSGLFAYYTANGKQSIDVCLVDSSGNKADGEFSLAIFR